MPKNDAMRSSAPKPSGKGKTVSFNDGPLQPEDMDMADVGNLEDMDMTLVERLRTLERELFDYQYNMGLLLIERKEWILKHEELQQSFVEVVEVLKRERASHLIKAEANSRKALDVERQCLSKNRSLDVQEKMIVADTMLSEANRKSLELDRKLHELEARESVLRREFVSFNSERNALEATFLKDKEDMKEWERKLQDVDEREEKKAESVRSTLEMKEKELIALSAKERVEIQKLLDEHRSILEMKKQVFELETEEKRKLLDEEMKVKHDNLDLKASEMNHMEEKLKKQEQTLENKLNKVKAKEKDTELKMKDFKQKEKSLKVEEKKLRIIEAEKNELEKMKAEVSQKEAQIHDQIEKLRITEAEKNEHIRLRMELKQEIERYNSQKDLLLKEREDLKQDRKKFEEEWETLDEKREQVNKEKIMIEKLKLSRENQLKEDKLETNDYIKRELESLRLEKESFDAKMKDEHNQLLCDFEARKRDLAADMMNKQEEMERNLWERERKLEAEIIELGILSQKLKLQRQQMMNERSRFLTFVETLKNCQNCGVMAKDYVLTDVDIIEEELLEKAASYRINNIKTKSSESGGRISWLLKKCTARIFNLSPNIEGPSTSPAQDTIGGNFEVQEHLEDSRESELSHHLHKSRGKADDIIPRKRSRPQPSRRKGTEDTDDSEWLPESESESETESSCSKRRHINASAILNASETRYNLRQHKIGGKAIASSTESDSETDNFGDATLSRYDEITSAPSGQVSSDNDTSKTIQTQNFPSNKVVKSSSADIAAISDDVKSTEMNCTPEDGVEHEHPGEASVTKKIWTFFTS